MNDITKALALGIAAATAHNFNDPDYDGTELQLHAEQAKALVAPPTMAINVGKRYSTVPAKHSNGEPVTKHENGAHVGVKKIRDKHMRRVLRKAGGSSALDRKTADAQRMRGYAGKVSTNSHAARRLIEAQREHVREQKRSGGEA